MPAHLAAWVRAFAASHRAASPYLTELDSAIGDADHGTNMKRGHEGGGRVAGLDHPPTRRALFKQVGMTLVSAVGGASGPLYGTLFLRMGEALGAARTVDAGASRRRCGPGSTASSPAARPSRATRRWSTRSRRRWRRSTQPLAGGRRRCRRPARGRGRGRRKGRDATILWWHARAAPATSASAARATRIREPRRRPCSFRPPPTHWRARPRGRVGRRLTQPCAGNRRGGPRRRDAVRRVGADRDSSRPGRARFRHDAQQIQTAIEEVDGPDGVVVLMDMGSAILSAEMALEFLDEDARSRVVLFPAPLIRV